MTAPLVQLCNVSKFYGGVPALRDINFSCEAGEIHAILGENGAGKSTLMKLLAGVIQPSSGSITVNGQEVSFASPRDAAACGIVCMFQELSLMPHLSVGDNIVLAGPETRFGFISRASYDKARDALKRIDAEHIPLNATVGSLSLAERQLVEIAKALYCQPKLLMLDEATSALTDELTEKVFNVVRDLRDQGVAIMFISHHMSEVDAISERISVFRNGQYVKTFGAGTLSHDEIVSLMIGQSLTELFPARPPEPAQPRPEMLKVRNLSWDGFLKQINVDVRAGEIVGLGGLDGQGQQHFMQALFGVMRNVEGHISLNGRSIEQISPSRAKKAAVGLAMVPEDRKTEGLIMDMSITDNLRLAALSQKRMGRLAIRDETDEKIDRFIKRLELTFGLMADPVSSLSGGNQQKVVLAKWLALSPRCILLVDPTRGIDIKTKAQIYRLLRDLADEGLAVVLQSTDHEELVHLCDRIYVFYDGTINRELTGDERTSEHLIAASMNLSAPAEAS